MIFFDISYNFLIVFRNKIIRNVIRKIMYKTFVNILLFIKRDKKDEEIKR